MRVFTDDAEEVTEASRRTADQKGNLMELMLGHDANTNIILANANSYQILIGSFYIVRFAKLVNILNFVVKMKEAKKKTFLLTYDQIDVSA